MTYIPNMSKDHFTVKNSLLWKDKGINWDRKEQGHIFTSLWLTLMMSPKYLMAGLNRSCMSQQKKMVVAGERLPSVGIYRKGRTNKTEQLTLSPIST